MRLRRLTGGVIASPAWLVARLVSRFGARLLDLRLDALVADEWPGRVVGAATNTHASNRFASTSVNGRAAWSTGGLDNSLLTPALSGAAKTVVLVAEASANVVSYETWAAFGAANIIVREAVSASFRTVEGHGHYVDGTASETIPTSGVHMIEAYKVGETTTALAYGGRLTASRSCSGKVAMALVLSDALSSGERVATLADARRFYRF